MRAIVRTLAGEWDGQKPSPDMPAARIELVGGKGMSYLVVTLRHDGCVKAEAGRNVFRPGVTDADELLDWEYLDQSDVGTTVDAIVRADGRMKLSVARTDVDLLLWRYDAKED